MGPHIRALGEGLVPSGQEIGITDHPITTSSEAQPARRADGWGGVTGAGQRGESKESPQQHCTFMMKTLK